MRALPSRILGNLLAHKVAQVSAESSHERCSRSDAVGIKSILTDNLPLPHSFSPSLAQYRRIQFTLCWILCVAAMTAQVM